MGRASGPAGRPGGPAARRLAGRHGLAAPPARRRSQVLADPSHAWRHATSVRVAAGRDVYLEEVKDTAMAMYSRRVALRVAERIGAIGDFNALTPASARALADRFGLDVPRHRARRSISRSPTATTRFSIYRLRP
ncbi:MAG: hypothetical protein M0C28_16415 [Candidatus Moduliflexus flocculans]|nr:hypothetical protein [Candidatus Moduliflexus flocculans]